MGSAGCVEIIGSFAKFKENIRDLSGSGLSADSALLQLVKEKNLYLEIEKATPPDIFNSRLKGKVYDPITRRINYET
jgi:hypothetical protein